MGCDVHMHIEVKVNGKWEHLGAPNVGRNYELFGKLAGVRDHSVQPIAEPRGVPKDITTLTKMDYLQWGHGAHSHSWLNSKEIQQLADYIRESDPDQWSDLEHTVLHTYLFGNSLCGPKIYKSDYPKGVEDVRLVFWFDN